ncbi:MAG: hypothetical protein AAGM67_09480, partial [Bacteroidota bacterium]
MAYKQSLTHYSPHHFHKLPPLAFRHPRCLLRDLFTFQLYIRSSEEEQLLLNEALAGELENFD